MKIFRILKTLLPLWVHLTIFTIGLIVLNRMGIPLFNYDMLDKLSGKWYGGFLIIYTMSIWSLFVGCISTLAAMITYKIQNPEKNGGNDE